MSAKPSTGPAAVVAVVATAVLLGIASNRASGHERATPVAFRLDEFLCYTFRPSSGIGSHTPYVRDQFLQRRKVAVHKAKSLCNPAAERREQIRYPAGHLLCYVISAPKTFQTRRVRARTNEFGTVVIDIVAPTSDDPLRLCLPSGKTIPPSVTARIPRRLDHYQCYPAKPVEEIKPRTLRVEDQFGAVKYDVGQPVRFCNPAIKDGSSILNKRDHLVCFAVALRTAKAKRVFVRNQFGRLFGFATTALELCLPSLKKVEPTS